MHEISPFRLINLSSLSGELHGTWNGSQRRHFLKDHLGSIRTNVDQSGNVDGYDDYYPFGLQIPGRTQNASNPNDDVKFTGYLLEQNGDLGIYHAEARMYDPVIGRFMQVDPLADEYPVWSPYVYAMNNPLRYNDPTGLCPEDGSAGKNQFGPGYCMEAIEVTAQRPRQFNFSTISLVSLSRVGGQTLVRSPNPYAITAGLFLLGGAIVADHFIDLTPSFDVSAEGLLQESSDVTIDGTDIILPKDPTNSPGVGWQWRGKGKVGSKEGAWHNPGTGESLHPDLDHPAPIGPHWDYKDRNGQNWRVDPKTGTKTPKN